MTDDTSDSDQNSWREIDSSAAHSARIWNYLLGGKDNYPVDQKVADQIAATFPAIIEVARLERHFLMRAVRFLAGEAGVSQFLDIGTGLPTANNTHEVAQHLNPRARIVYVDNDPLVLVHAEALLTSTPEGATDYIEADLRDPETIVREARRTLDFTQPIALVMFGILGQIPDTDHPHEIVRRLLAELPCGSYLAICDGTDIDPAFNEAVQKYNANPESDSSYHPRSPEQIENFFDGLELLEPGVVQCSQWRPDPSQWENPDVVDYGGVARKP